MPYNTTPLAPRLSLPGHAPPLSNLPVREPDGTTKLPLIRVKRIIKLDPDIVACSNASAFIITIASEMFIQYLAEQAHILSKVKPGGDRKKTLMYNDLANAVSKLDTLEFLSDVIPHTIPLKNVKQKPKIQQAPKRDKMEIDP
ncbi:DNA polymerase epsilon subunit C [Neolecta irregularis DAH-3]|uniref:DNA polymerase epsilon subunit C n=1 Tax=Neolecta irregularis (strain DAH-3) TaxID=1198029 RepID=A0A1U7LU88_NEOID|nr:DNA polymerase epsilon subunit C [Neolecta irregularis DAH-3]|eukprot:OLL26143.1 DNA polymerase epsilon subunit C [Neolecta irregularis DAH-3]